MLLKEKKTPAPVDKFGKAGHEAEMQMAFYLRRAFAEDRKVLVLNDLRLERNGEIAQLDHLVLHRFGFVIVESKSVVGKLVVNSRGEFSRIWNGNPRGMQSPIQQARLQAELLARLLNDHKEKLRRKVLFGLKQGHFAEERFRVLVAVSDSGVIKREGIDPPELLKADSIVDAIKNTITSHEEATSFGGFLRSVTADSKEAKQLQEDNLTPLTDDEMFTIGQFLLARHTTRESLVPAVPANFVDEEEADSDFLVEATLVVPARSPELPLCKHCNSQGLTIVYGRYGYYYKCQTCEQNTPIDLACTQCGEKARISKSGPLFRRVCHACGQETQFHMNRDLDGTVS